ncbi:uncharacterized protein O3Q21_005778 [Podargus strigoides]
MSPALSLLLSLASCTLLRGKSSSRATAAATGGETRGRLSDRKGTCREGGTEWSSRRDRKENPRVTSNHMRVSVPFADHRWDVPGCARDVRAADAERSAGSQHLPEPGRDTVFLWGRSPGLRSGGMPHDACAKQGDPCSVANGDRPRHAVASARREAGGTKLPRLPAVGAGPRLTWWCHVPGGVEESLSHAFHSDRTARARQPSFLAGKLQKRRNLCIFSMSRTSRWTKADTCWGNSTGSSWACELYFDKIHDIYWARVRAVAGGELSEWTRSGELQLYRDTIVGPPKLSWLLQGHILSVNIIMPLTPYQSKTGSFKPVDQVLLKLWYRLHLYEGDEPIQEVPCKWSGEEAQCTFSYLKPSTQYCIRTEAVGMAREKSQEAEQCMVTLAGPTAGFPWVVLAVLTGVFLLLSMAGLCIIHLHIFPSPSETHLPETLALLNGQLSVTIRVPTLELKEDSLSWLLPTVLPSSGTPAAEQPAVQLLLGESLSQDMSGYCANGFGPDCHEGRDPSCTHGQLGHALGCQVSLRLEENGEVCDGDDVLEQLVPVRLTKDSYAGDRDYWTPETWLSLHLQLYSKYQCPALGAGSCLPLPTPDKSFSQEDPQESLGMAGHWVPLSSVKLPAREEEDEGQLVHALQSLHGHGTKPQPGDSTMQQGDLEQAAPCIPLPSPCQLPQLPPNILQAAAFSGYEAAAPLQFGGSDPSAEHWRVMEMPRSPQHQARARAKLLPLHVPGWECPHLGTCGKCLRSGGATGTLLKPS